MAFALEVATSSPRAGRRFEPIQERELHRDALAATQGLPGVSRGLVVVPEFAGPIGIPDFTAYVGDIERLRHRHRLDVPPVLNELDAGVVTSAHVRRALGVKDLAGAQGWPAAAISDRIRGLVRRGALVKVATDRYVRPAALEPGGRLYAIEAKVEDWRSALRQVRTYRVWADSYVLVMGQITERAQATLVAEVRSDRGGLMVAGRWVVRPRLGNTSARRRVQAWELYASATQAGLHDPALTVPVHA
ncbi:hypothetical protein ACWPKO_29975 (plasmid) [Coraliomargarita sp. W4R53]